MPTQYGDSTEHYDLSADCARKWTLANFGVTPGIIPDGSGKRGLSVGAGVGKTLPYSNTTVAGFRVYWDNQEGFAGEGQVYQVSQAAETLLGGLYIEHDNTLSFYAGAREQNRLLCNSGSSAIFVKGKTSYYMEVLTETTGVSSSKGNPIPISVSMQLMMNGQSIMSGSGATGFTTDDMLFFNDKMNFHFFSNANIINGFAWMRDFYIRTDDPTFLGDIQLSAIFPHTDVEGSGWGGVGIGANLHDFCRPQFPEINDDTTYIQAQSVGSRVSFLFDPIPPGSQVVFVHLGANHKKDAEGSRAFKFLNAGVEVGGFVAPGDDYRYDFIAFDKDNNGAAWTVASVNATPFGMKIES